MILDALLLAGGARKKFGAEKRKKVVDVNYYRGSITPVIEP